MSPYCKSISQPCPSAKDILENDISHILLYLLNINHHNHENKNDNNIHQNMSSQL